MKSLIVEDDFIARHILKEFLAPYGKCDIAVDGEEGVQAFRLAWQENKPYDLVCLDIMMPKINGHEALRQIRELEKELKISSGVKVVMVTALSDMNNLLRATTEGEAAFYMVKPINKQKLDRLLAVF